MPTDCTAFPFKGFSLMYSRSCVFEVSMTKNSRRSGRRNKITRPQNPGLALVPRNLPRQNKWISADAPAALNAFLTTAAPLVATLNPLAQGTSNVTRVGSKVRLGRLDLRLFFQTGLGVLANSLQVRVVVVRDAAAEGVITTTGEVFTNATPGVRAPQNMVTVNPSRYQIMHDWVSNRNDWVPANFLAATDPVQDCLHMVRMPLGFVTDYSRGNAGTVADIDTNALTVFIVTDNTTADALAVTGSYLLSFTDE